MCHWLARRVDWIGWTWTTPTNPKTRINLATAPLGKPHHIVTDSMRRVAWVKLEARRLKQNAGMWGEVDTEATTILLSQGREFECSLLWGWIVGVLWTARQAHERKLRASPHHLYYQAHSEIEEHII